jgi:DNA-directed RNA polymerase subunit RPC12/RpoP
MACPRCGKQATEYDEKKWQCLHCGTKFLYEEPKAPIVNVHQVYRSGEGPQPVWCCPRCGGTNVQLLRMVYEAGTQETSLAGVGVGLGSGGPGLGVAGGLGMTTSLLASRCRPPGDTMASGIAVASVGIALVLGMLIFLDVDSGGGLLSVLLGPVLVLSEIGLIKGYLAARAGFRRQLRTWSETVICLTCGETFLSAEGRRQQVEDRDSLYRHQQAEAVNRGRRARERAQRREAFRASIANARARMGAVARGFDGSMAKIVGEDNRLVYRFLQAVLYLALPTIAVLLLCWALVLRR